MLGSARARVCQHYLTDQPAEGVAAVGDVRGEDFVEADGAVGPDIHIVTKSRN